jgi:hypothetical protein
MNVWLVNQEGTLTSSEMEVNKCIKQQLDLNLVSRYKTTKNIQNVTKKCEEALRASKFSCVGCCGVTILISPKIGEDDARR